MPIFMPAMPRILRRTLGVPRKQAMTSRPDSDIKRSIECELRRCLVDESHIAIRVIGGAVTLTGWVGKYFHKYGAEDVVKRVAGVTAIANDIRIWHPAPRKLSDREISRGPVMPLRRRTDAGPEG